MTTPDTSQGTVAPFHFSHVLDAPRALVWQVYTSLDHLTRWYGPQGTEVLHAHMELTPGGVYHYGMRMPDGHEMWGKQRYREVVPHEKLVFIQSFSDREGGLARHPAAPTWPLEMFSITEFEDVAEARTRIAVTWEPHDASEAERQTFDQARSGMTGGFASLFAQLEAYLASLPEGR